MFSVNYIIKVKRDWRVPSTSASVRFKLGYSTLLSLGWVHEPGSSLNPTV